MKPLVLTTPIGLNRNDLLVVEHLLELSTCLEEEWSELDGSGYRPPLALPWSSVFLDSRSLKKLGWSSKKTLLLEPIR
jgi:hypothetical protein